LGKKKNKKKLDIQIMFFKLHYHADIKSAFDFPLALEIFEIVIEESLKYTKNTQINANLYVIFEV
jgi:hypothetical protein